MCVRAFGAIAVGLLCLWALAGAQGAGQPGPAAAPPGLSAAAREVWDTEVAFARTMAARDHAGFVSFLSPEAVFMGATRILRGKAEVADGWKPFYEGPRAPFSWAPDRVEVLPSGTLASSSGPVFDPAGKRTGTFNSVWRRDPDGKWRIVFDSGCPPCKSE
jgi:ketosteroid isomerase-like protein